MAIEIRENFRLDSPLETVWRFLLNPNAVVVCMPGAELQEAIDDRTFAGRMKVKVGPVVVSYSGRATFADVDEANRVVRVVAHAKETQGSGTAKGTMTSTLRASPEGGTEVSLVATVDVTGRIMHFGARMLEGVSHQLLQEFVACTRSNLAVPGGDGAMEEGAAAAYAKPIPAVSLVLKTIWSGIVNFLRRLLRRTSW